jgi:hypothetical protein
MEKKDTKIKGNEVLVAIKPCYSRISTSAPLDESQKVERHK